VIDIDLFPHEQSFTTRQAWQVIDAARHQFLTGELTLEVQPPVRVFMRDGYIYFAERTTDGALGVRLLLEGVITRDQMHRGTLVVSGREHLGRLFELDETIDRLPVELCVEMFTDEVLSSIAAEDVATYQMSMYQRHPSGVDRWFPATVQVVTRVVDAAVLSEHAPEPADSEPAAAASVPGPATAGRSRPMIGEVDPTHEMPALTDLDMPDGPVQTPAPVSTPVSAPAPVSASQDPSSPDASPGPGEFDESMSAAIANEVADAIGRALAAIENAGQPQPQITPADFDTPAFDTPAFDTPAFDAGTVTSAAT